MDIFDKKGKYFESCGNNERGRKIGTVPPKGRLHSTWIEMENSEGKLKNEMLIFNENNFQSQSLIKCMGLKKLDWKINKRLFVVYKGLNWAHIKTTYISADFILFIFF